MGNSVTSGQKTHLRRCLPSKKLVTFPQTMNGAPGDLVTYFHSKPPGYSLPSNTPEEQLFWWTDVDFIPFQDNCLFVSVGAYIHRPHRPPLKPSQLLQGLIYVWTFREDKHRVEILKGSRTAILPNVSVHPSGECILYIGNGAIRLLNIFSMKEIKKAKDASMSNFQCTAQSPCGYQFAYITKISNKVELGFFSLDGIFFLEKGLLDCNKLCCGFKSDGSFTDHYGCKFSKDSQIVAASSSLGHLITVRVGKRELHCAVSPGLIGWSTDRLANERSFDFDNRYPHEKLAFGSDKGKVYFCDIENGKIENSISIGDGEIQCVKSSPSGEKLAVASSIGVIHLLDPDTGDCSLTLDARHLIPDAAIRSVHGELAAVVQMAYTTHGEHLAVSYTDGYVRIWKLHQNINLQDLCIRSLLKMVGFSLLSELPLPKKLLDDIIAKYND